MPQAYLDITPELLCVILQAAKAGPGERKRMFEVTKNAVPADATVVDVQYQRDRDVVRMVVQSKHVRQGEVMASPELTVVYENEPVDCIEVDDL